MDCYICQEQPCEDSPFCRKARDLDKMIHQATVMMFVIVLVLFAVLCWSIKGMREARYEYEQMLYDDIGSWTYSVPVYVLGSQPEGEDDEEGVDINGAGLNPVVYRVFGNGVSQH